MEACKSYRELLVGLGAESIVYRTLAAASRGWEVDGLNCMVVDRELGSPVRQSDLADILVPVVLLVAPTDAVENDVKCVFKPVARHDLVDAIESALGASSCRGAGSVGVVTPLRRLRVLVADDSVTNQEVASGLLELEGHTIRTVSDGLEAVDACEEETFDVILMDLEMPGMDGFEATKTIRNLEAHRQSPATPVIAMTAHVSQTVANRCLEGGMNGYVSKPIDSNELLSTIEQATSASCAGL